MAENNDWRKDKRHRDGSIKTIKGILYARIQYIDDITGRRREKLRRANNRKDARELIKEMRSELHIGGQDTLRSDKITFKEVAEKYEKIHLVPAVFRDGIKVAGKRSVKPSKSALNHLVDHFGLKPIRSIKTSDLEAYKVKRLHTPVEIEINVKISNPEISKKKFLIKKVIKKRPRKISTVNREIAVLQSVFKFAKNDKLITDNPFDYAGKIVSLSAEISRDRILSYEEEKCLLVACDNDFRRHLRPIIITALDTAARRGELLKLQWKDIDFSTGTITIRATNSKTEKMRKIGMTSRSKDELLSLWNQSPQNIEELVFGIKDSFKKAWGSAVREAGIKDLHFHDLRHTATTRLIRAGVPNAEAMEVTGHSQPKTFQRYVNLTVESVSAAANLLDNYLANQKIKDESEKGM